MWDNKYSEELTERRMRALAGGGAERVEKQHSAGKLTARERIEALFDPGSFVEILSLAETRHPEDASGGKSFPGDGVVVGYGTVGGRIVYASSEDFTVMGGSLGEVHSRKICRIMDMAIQMQCPYVSINDSGGARIEEGVSSLDGYSGMFFRNTRASGLIPQIAVVLGPCAGGACYSPAIMDFVFMSRRAGKMFITGPDVVKAATGEDVSMEDLGGASMHGKKSGVLHFSFPDDEACLLGVRKLLSYLPGNSWERPPFDGNFRGVDNSYLLQEIVSDNQRKVYDIKEVLDCIVDRDSFLEVQDSFACNLIVGLARLDGHVTGIVANNPRVLGGALDIDASDKGARFIRFCDSFNIPILTLVDVPGFFPGKEQEQGGIIRHGAKLLYAYSEATVPKITLIMRKAFGGAYIAMNSRGMGADIVFSWPIAQVAVMGAEGAVGILYKKELSGSDHADTRRDELVQEYREKFMTPYIAAERGFIDEVILPEETRRKLSDSFSALRNKTLPIGRKHGNIPL